MSGSGTIKQLHCRDWIFFLRMLKPWYSRFRISPSLISCPLTWLWPCMGLCLKVLLESESPSRSLLSFCLLGLCGFVFPILWHDRDHLFMSVRPEPFCQVSVFSVFGVLDLQFSDFVFSGMIVTVYWSLSSSHFRVKLQKAFFWSVSVGNGSVLKSSHDQS